MLIEQPFEINGVELIFRAEITKVIRATQYAHNGDPGSPEEGGLEELSIYLGEVDITEVVSQEVLERAEQEAFYAFEGQGEVTADFEYDHRREMEEER